MLLKHIAVAISLLAFGVAAHAAEPLIDEKGVPGKFSANVALTNEYVFRGMS